MGSGDSTGEFCDMSPNTEIRDLKKVIRWAQKRGFRRIGLLGISFGGAVTISTAARLPPSALTTIVTWSSVPGWKIWRQPPGGKLPRKNEVHPLTVGPQFYTDRPAIEVGDSYAALSIPKLQIQGDHDLPGFREAFTQFFPRASAPKKHIVVPGADHVFTQWPHRQKVIKLTVNWFCRHLKP
jgi:pimeloyl-ACP methyl ester carboxylesterase